MPKDFPAKHLETTGKKWDKTKNTKVSIHYGTDVPEEQNTATDNVTAFY